MMSQPDRSEAPLNEEELKEYINTNYDFKLTKDDLVRPSCDTLIEVYARFVDDFESGWRETDNWIKLSNPRWNNDTAEDVTAFMFEIVRRIRPLVSRFDQKGFTLHDIVSPERKRTCFILNILIYLRLQLFEVALPKFNMLCQQGVARKEQMQKLEQVEEQVKKEIEELRLDPSYRDDIEDLGPKIKEAKEKFEQEKKKGEDLAARAQELKQEGKAKAFAEAQRKGEAERDEKLNKRWGHIIDLCEKYNKVINDITPEALVAGQNLVRVLEELRQESKSSNKTFEGDELLFRNFAKIFYDFYKTSVERQEIVLKIEQETQEIERKNKELVRRVLEVQNENAVDDKKLVDLRLQGAAKIAESREKFKELESQRKLNIDKLSSKLDELKKTLAEKKQELDNIATKRRQLGANANDHLTRNIKLREELIYSCKSARMWIDKSTELIGTLE